MRSFLLAALSLTVSLTSAARADTLSTITFGGFLESPQYGFGQSFTSAPGGSYNNIKFNFYTTTHIIAPPMPYYYEVDPNFPKIPLCDRYGLSASQRSSIIRL